MILNRSQGDQQNFLQGPSIQLTVRRSHLYEDAFDKLRIENRNQNNFLTLSNWYKLAN